MDSLFGIGIPELVIILLLAGLVLGPQRIRQIAYTLGRITAQMQKVSREFTRQLNAELDSLEDGSIRDTMHDVRELQKEVQELRRELARAPKSLQEAGQKLTEEAEKSVRDEVTAVDQAAKSDNQSKESTRPDSQSDLPKAIDVPGDPD
jgi:Sec-independent protein translocase protein TatA